MNVRSWSAAFVFLATGSLFGGETPSAVTVPLQAVSHPNEEEGPWGHREVDLKPGGRGEMDFSTGAGTLVFSYAQGYVHPDRNGDGVADEADGKRVSMGEMFTVPTVIQGKPFDYPLVLFFVHPNYVVFSGRARLEGSLGETRLYLYDGNVNGRFDEPGKDALQVGDEGRPVPLGRILSLNGALWTWALPPEELVLKLDPYAGPGAGLALETSDPQWTVNLLLGRANDDHYLDIRLGETAILPAGEYQVWKAVAQRLPDVPGEEGWKDIAHFVSADIEDESEIARLPALAMAAGENRVKVGPPFRVTFTATRSSVDERQIDLHGAALVGLAGERYSTSPFGPGGKRTVASLIRTESGETEITAADIEMGVPENCLFLLPEALQKAPDAEIVLRYTYPAVGTIEASVRLDGLKTETPPLWDLLDAAIEREKRKDYPGALRLYESLLQAFPDKASPKNDLAWLLLTAEDKPYRDPARALALSRQAAEMTGEKDGAILDTLALALHEAGDIEGAVKYSALAAAKLPLYTEIVERAEAYRKELEAKQKASALDPTAPVPPTPSATE
ncbi:MAG: hypothetical protein V1918_10495 [Planctomycetota bacterium]